ncbi:flagellar hook-associated protein FlgK [Methylophilus medardicus]|uniref:Flagellar hook-associated protein 1 n=1 Tax=Methylophilus medardicus TaxID=2588534 RepID=A0A5B8CSN2_9PROT|nr:flagellar hook-associated protein FlgK [Methylophilus medardicus]QDC44322.1 flagellar hook-associated protein FlgK [Methylophilus medardicus]QDC49329.1 flagellar hook-associated protein FlgK [Methylophilus medardicus]QDC53034.1 flagellar hook-associated protein FlgK [Methylophilus medardicus]
MSNVLSIGKSALNAAQIGIATVGHNISNASTPGYNRQVVVQAAAQAQNFGYGYVGQGTNVVGIQRVFNDTLSKQVINATATSNASGAYYSNISQVNGVLSDSTAGLNPVITSFFSAVSAAAANPSDTATRQTLISSAQSMVNRFNAVNNQLDQMRESINTQITSSVDAINSYSTQIATLNDTITKAVNSTGNTPNDLMDQRDQLVAKLSEQIKTTVIKQDDGSYNVFAGTGMPLVVGTQQYSLYTRASDTDPTRVEVAYGNPASPKILSVDTVSGGTLGGVLQFRSETLDSVQNQVGQLAMTLASQFNAQQTQGYDLNGTLGTNLFSIGGPTAISSAYNTDPTKTASASILDPSLLTNSDYTVKYNSGMYTITRVNDKSIMWQGTALPATIDGMEVNVNTSSPTEGDSYLIKPTQYAAGKLSMAFTDVDKLALAGSATTGPNDNENGLKLAALQTGANVRVAGSNTNRTYTQAFAQMVSAVGTKTNELSITSKADAMALENATSAMQSESGVNLDEEATDLLRYQQAYQAAGKMMQIASQLFEVLLQMGQ